MRVGLRRCAFFRLAFFSLTSTWTFYFEGNLKAGAEGNPQPLAGVPLRGEITSADSWRNIAITATSRPGHAFRGCVTTENACYRPIINVLCGGQLPSGPLSRSFCARSTEADLWVLIGLNNDAYSCRLLIPSWTVPASIRFHRSRPARQ